MASLPFSSPQASIGGDIDLLNLEDLASSPLKYRGENASLVSASTKLRKPPTVTPKRFTKFFTPRNVTSGTRGRPSRAGRQLRDITRNAINARHATQTEGVLGDEVDDNLSSRPTKRRKQSFDICSSPPVSSPLRRSHPAAGDIDFCVDQAGSEVVEEDEDDLPDRLEALRPFPLPIRTLRHDGKARRILERSFGGYASTARGWRGTDHGVDWRSETADFVTTPADLHPYHAQALPFCTTSCNTNSLVAIGDEDGSVDLIDTANGADFRKPHVNFKAHRNAVMDVAFSSDDYTFATASGDQTARVFDMHTQRPMYNLTGHTGSLKQIRFHPGDDKMLTTSSRDGSVQVWDLRCSTKTATQILKPADSDKSDAQTLYSKYSIQIGAAHRNRVGLDANSRAGADDGYRGSVTAFQHLNAGRGHMLVTASEANASLKLWDLRNAGRRGNAIPVSSTPVPENHGRHFGISALALSGDGARVYAVCRDSVVYAYATNHLVSGCAPEMSTKPTGRRAAREGRMGAAPLYGLRHPSLRVGTFYVRASIRPAQGDKSELLAVGSTDGQPILFPTDKRHLPQRGNRHRKVEDAEEDEAELPTLPRRSSRLSSAATGPPVHEHGTALVRGHSKEVTSLTFTSEGHLVSVSDDFTTRCWRETREQARYLRSCGEGGGERWGMGWADVDAEWDEDDG
ncbi:hypothetical protein B0A48_04667 [Cryoendolithus antarcticus]|uniref:Anaphase-promoting complex subunit 4 WD40 domain-containing protein n=1 Tax=Cryoendolithus antarcticus TaxID=1507870 RepID=A0A1V8TFZ5_9PEZI|nr:hypothetical protein B0A48_04667 [Cryoendolithus antarcticus]